MSHKAQWKMYVRRPISPKPPRLTVPQYELALRTALLEKEYQATLGHTAQLLDAEKSRVTKVEQLLLQFENETLRYQLDRADRELANMMKEEYKSRSILDGARQELNELRNQQRFASQEIERLRVCTPELRFKPTSLTRSDRTSLQRLTTPPLAQKSS